jgi:hypothetical protein
MSTLSRFRSEYKNKNRTESQGGSGLSGQPSANGLNLLRAEKAGGHRLHDDRPHRVRSRRKETSKRSLDDSAAHARGGREQSAHAKPAYDSASIFFQKFAESSRDAAASVGGSRAPVLGALVTPVVLIGREETSGHPPGRGCTGVRASAKQSSVAIAPRGGVRAHARSAGSSSPHGAHRSSFTSVPRVSPFWRIRTKYLIWFR